MTLVKNKNKNLQLIHKPKRLKCFTYSLTQEKRKEIELQKRKERTLRPLERKLKKHARKNKLRKN